MTLLSTEQLVEQIHDSPTRIVLATAGGGSRAIADLLDVPGASRTLLEALVPYSAPAMAAWLGTLPDGHCSATTARAMAMAAFLRARRYEAEGGSGIRESAEPLDRSSLIPDPSSASLAGVACTASLASDRPKRGEHRIHVALQTVSTTAAWHVQLQKGRRSRGEEERLAGHLLLNVVAEACGLSERLTLDLLEGEQVEESRTQAPLAWQDLLLGKIDTVRIGPASEPPLVLLPGAFNPLHEGHCRIMAVARERLGRPPVAEISIVNVDKPPLDYAEIERRLAQFPADQPICLTRAASFDEKSRLFAGATFLVGVDTLLRIADPRYYDNDASACRRAVEQIAARGCRFLVFGRNVDACFTRLADLDVPESLQTICREVPPEVFREDVTSTELRSRLTPD